MLLRDDRHLKRELERSREDPSNNSRDGDLDFISVAIMDQDRRFRRMRVIYFEKQVAAMCGQHLLNNLTQGNYFEPASLSNIALALDEQERGLGLSVDAMRQGSQNVDESGNFSIQVLEVALNNSFQVKLRRDEDLTKALALVDDSKQPETKVEQTAFVFNFESHWFCARYLHGQYWVLNSTEAEPRAISRTMLSMFVKQMQAEGWSVFVTLGKLPAPALYDEGPNWFFLDRPQTNEADSAKKVKPFQGKGYSLKDTPELEDEDDELRQAVLASLVDYDASLGTNKIILEEEPDASIKSAIMIQLILPPSGKKVRRRFRSEATIDQIFAWANSLSDFSGRVRSIQKVEDRADLVRSEAISSLGNGCSLRVVVV